MPKVRLIIAGTRPPKEIRSSAPLLEQWYEERAERVQDMVNAALKQFNLRQRDIIEEISGKASGWDTLGEMWARSNGIEVVEFPAEWRDASGNLDRGAGMKRNEAMALYAACEQPEVVGLLVAAWDGKSAGTRNMAWNADRTQIKSWCWADQDGEFDGRAWDL